MKATKQTLGLILSVFVVQMIGVRFLQAIQLEYFTLAYPLFESQPWAIILNVYSHAGFGHLISNAIALIILGLIVERVTTVARFHAFFITTGVIAGIAEVTFWLIVGSGATSVLGASGAIFALMGYALIGNDLAETFIESLDLGKKGTLLLFVGIAIFITLMTGGQGVALIAHATGLLMGAISGHLRVLHTED